MNICGEGPRIRGRRVTRVAARAACVAALALTLEACGGTNSLVDEGEPALKTADFSKWSDFRGEKSGIRCNAENTTVFGTNGEVRSAGGTRSYTGGEPNVVCTEPNNSKSISVYENETREAAQLRAQSVPEPDRIAGKLKKLAAPAEAPKGTNCNTVSNPAIDLKMWTCNLAIETLSISGATDESLRIAAYLVLDAVEHVEAVLGG